MKNLTVLVFVLIVHMFETDAARCFQSYGLSRLVERVFLQFHQSLGGGEHRYSLRYELGEVTCRSLYTADELQKGGHAAKGQRAARHAQGSPEKGDEIAQTEAQP